jgi:hypothetical protein
MWSANVQWWMAQGHVHGCGAMHSMLRVLWRGGVADRGVELIQALNIEGMEASRARPVRRDAVVDRYDAHGLDDVAGVEELGPDAGFLSRANRLCFNLAGAAGRELAHR